MYFCLSNSLQQTPGRSPYWCLSSFYFYLSIIENSLWLPSRIISVIKYFDNPGKMLTKGPRDLKRKENLFGRSKTEESGKLTHLRRLRPKTAACLGASDHLDWGAAWGAPLPLRCWLVWQFSPRICWFLPHQDPPSTRTSWTLSTFKRFCTLGFGKTYLNFRRGSMKIWSS